jgi:ribonuclease P protein component
VLAAGQRLRGRTEFTATVRGGRRVVRGCIVVHLHSLEAPPERRALEGRDPGQRGQAQPARARAGFVVGKAVGPAVVRNKVRRRLRHLVRARLAQLPSGTDIVVRALPQARSRSYADLGADLDAAIAVARSPRRRQGVSR